MYGSLSAGGREAAVAAGMPSYFMATFGIPAAEEEVSGELQLPERAMVVSRNHREAEKRRRERIKSHLDRLRSILCCDPKTDKASLLAKAVAHLKDLKHRAAEIAGAAELGDFFPSETDEIAVLQRSSGSGASAVFEASVCCDDRAELLPELIETLRGLRLRTLRAEMATIGGRVRSVLVVSGDGGGGEEDSGGGFLRNALKELVEHGGGGGGSKRRRVMYSRNTA